MIQQWIPYILWGLLLLVAGIVAAKGLWRETHGEHDDLEVSWRYRPKAGVRALAVLGAGVILLSSLVIVPAGHRAVVFNQGTGVQEFERGEGISFVVPFFQQATLVDVRTKVYVYESFVQSQDLQEITLPIAVNYHVDPNQANVLYQTVGNKGIYEPTIIDPAVYQASTQAVGQVKAAAIAQSRAQLAQQIATVITPPLATHGLVVEFVSIKDAVFDPQFIGAVKKKVIAAEQAVQEQNLVAAAQYKAEQVVKEAEGRAEAIRVVADAQAEANDAIAVTVTDGLVAWWRADRWNGTLPGTWLGGADPLDLLFSFD
jgi:regulator of protease activity HflC (stomatin/prohibitin superfamily)